MVYYLMHKDTLVLRLNDGRIANHQFVPYPLKPKSETGFVNTNMLNKWVRKRAIPLSRKNANKIYMAMGMPRENFERELMLITHALSINDNYWIASEQEVGQLHWKDINLYNNKLSNSLCQLVFTGSGPATITDNTLSAEFTGQGTFAKCFTRGSNGRLSIYKQGTNKEIAAEVLASYIGRVLGIPCIEYKYEPLYGIDASVSEIYTNEAISWESAFWFTTYTESISGLNIYDFASKHMTYMYYTMILLDGLVLNEDRHLQNWSIQLSGEDNSIQGMAPLYDFNKAFSGDSKTMSQFIPGKNILSAARDAEDILKLDLITSLVPIVDNLPKSWQEPFYNRIEYISRKRQNQSYCY